MRKIWEKLNGKKTAIGIGLHAAWFITNMVFKDFATMDEVLTGHALIGTITGVGATHKISKAISNAKQKN